LKLTKQIIAKIIRITGNKKILKYTFLSQREQKLESWKIEKHGFKRMKVNK
jgi:hypothetical protein